MTSSGAGILLVVAVAAVASAQGVPPTHSGDTVADCRRRGSLLAYYRPLDRCMPLLDEQSPCSESGAVLVLNTTSQEAYCLLLPCALSHVLLTDNRCHPKSEVCADRADMELVLSETGYGTCDCLDGYLFWQPTGRCYPAFTRGPCAVGENIVFSENADGSGGPGSVRCVPTPCPPGEVSWQQQCVSQRGHGCLDSVHGHLVLNPASLQYQCTLRCPSGMVEVSLDCYNMFSRGPCQYGEYVEPVKGTRYGRCVPNPCERDNSLPWDGRCWMDGDYCDDDDDDDYLDQEEPAKRLRPAAHHFAVFGTHDFPHDGGKGSHKNNGGKLYMEETRVAAPTTTHRMPSFGGVMSDMSLPTTAVASKTTLLPAEFHGSTEDARTTVRRHIENNNQQQMTGVRESLEPPTSPVLSAATRGVFSSKSTTTGASMSSLSGTSASPYPSTADSSSATSVTVATATSSTPATSATPPTSTTPTTSTTPPTSTTPTTSTTPPTSTTPTTPATSSTSPTPKTSPTSPTPKPRSSSPMLEAPTTKTYPTTSHNSETSTSITGRTSSATPSAPGTRLPLHLQYLLGTFPKVQDIEFLRKILPARRWHAALSPRPANEDLSQGTQQELFPRHAIRLPPPPESSQALIEILGVQALHAQASEASAASVPAPMRGTLKYSYDGKPIANPIRALLRSERRRRGARLMTPPSAPQAYSPPQLSNHPFSGTFEGNVRGHSHHIIVHPERRRVECSGAVAFSRRVSYAHYKCRAGSRRHLLGDCAREQPGWIDSHPGQCLHGTRLNLLTAQCKRLT